MKALRRGGMAWVMLAALLCAGAVAVTALSLDGGVAPTAFAAKRIRSSASKRRSSSARDLTTASGSCGSRAAGVPGRDE